MPESCWPTRTYLRTSALCTNIYSCVLLGMAAVFPFLLLHPRELHLTVVVCQSSQRRAYDIHQIQYVTSLTHKVPLSKRTRGFTVSA